MPFKTIKLNDGRQIPEIGFGTWKIPQDVTSQQVQQGIEVGFDHVDTAQVRPILESPYVCRLTMPLGLPKRS